MLETPGTASAATYTFDETLFAVYSGGQAGITAGGGATVSLYLYDESTGIPLTNNGYVVCAPCAYTLGGAAPRKVAIRMDDLIVAAGGGFDAAAKRATGIVVVGGADPANVTLQPWLINAHSNAFDLAITPQVAQPVTSAGLAAILPDDRPGMVQALRVSPNPAAGSVRFTVHLAAPGEVEMSVFDLAGRVVAELQHGRWAAGEHELRWDGRDAAGRPLGGGVYFVRLDGADHSVCSRVILLP
jgi:hypothetical protein